MPELKREPLTRGEASDMVGADMTLTCFDEDHTHSDILRYVISDLGLSEARQLMIQICREETRANRKRR